MSGTGTRFAAEVRLARLSMVGLAGRRALPVAMLTGLWPLLLKVFALLGEGGGPEPQSVAAWVLGLPAGVLALALGCRIVGSEVDQRTLEIVYTVPGGARRVWLARFGAAALLVLFGELVVAAIAFVLLVDVPPFDVVSSFTGALFLLAIGMLFGALFRGVITAALAGAPVLAVSLLIPGSSRFAPFFSTAWLREYDRTEIVTWAFQSRTAFLLATALVVAMAVSRAENREAMLRG